MMTRRPARIALIALISAAFLVVTGCGDKEAVTTDAKTEGIWLDAGRLDYHIQGSRVLNPGITPDNAYLKGLPSNATAPTGRELWFAVFLRIENRTKQAALTARQFEIVDTQGNQFTPFLIKQSANPFAYSATKLPPNKVIPVPDSPQDFDSFSGAMLLFKLPIKSYLNRPLSFKIHSADGTGPAEAQLDLDV